LIRPPKLHKSSSQVHEFSSHCDLTVLRQCPTTIYKLNLAAFGLYRGPDQATGFHQHHDTVRWSLQTLRCSNQVTHLLRVFADIALSSFFVGFGTIVQSLRTKHNQPSAYPVPGRLSAEHNLHSRSGLRTGQVGLGLAWYSPHRTHYL
jgi:hypothetical protein